MNATEANWIEVRIAAPEDAGELIAALDVIGSDEPACQGAWYDGAVWRLYWRAAGWSEQTAQRIRGQLARLMGLDEAVLTVTGLRERDWNAAWAETVRPIRVGRRLVIRPSWARPPSSPADLELVIDPKQAFGTGHHATTRLLLEWLEDVIVGGERVVDVGTGTGILAMAAIRLGAASAIGIDHDPVAIDCAREAVIHNGFGSELELRVAEPGALLDDARAVGAALVLANLDRNTLVRDAGRLIALSRPRGRLLVSGILESDREDVGRAFLEAGGSVSGERVSEGWVALQMRVPKPRGG